MRTPTGCIQGLIVMVRRGRLKGRYARVMFHRTGLDLVGIAYKGGTVVLRRSSVEIPPSKYEGN